MKTIEEIKPQAQLAFDSFKNKVITANQLVIRLQYFERILTNGKGKKQLWFRFFNDDTLATDIDDINRNLSTTGKNHNHLIECIDIAVANQSLQIYFS